eukprot:1733632-Amphidinium_carterae.1
MTVGLRTCHWPIGALSLSLTLARIDRLDSIKLGSCVGLKWVRSETYVCRHLAPCSSSDQPLLSLRVSKYVFRLYCSRSVNVQSSKGNLFRTYTRNINDYLTDSNFSELIKASNYRHPLPT